MSTAAVHAGQAPVPEPCASCGAPLAHDQRYCLQCGELRAGARRREPAALRGVVRAAGETAAATDTRALPGTAVLLAGLACLLLAMGIGVLIGRGGGEPAAQAPITVAAAVPPPAAAADASFASDWAAGTDGWTVALAQLAKATATPLAVAQAKTEAQGKGAPAVGALDADAYPSLTSGSYVVYSGVFENEKAAKAARAALTAAFPDARVVRVGKGAAAPAAAATGKVATKAGSAKKRTPAKQGASDTKSEFEKSKKAPKTVGTGGTPPPKDDKPAAGGGGFQDIG